MSDVLMLGYIENVRYHMSKCQVYVLDVRCIAVYSPD